MSERTNLKGHTKTPWKLFVGKHSNLVEILDTRGNPIVGWNGFDDSRRSFEEHKANAMLIVDAVNKHAALKRMLDRAMGVIDGEREPCPICGEMYWAGRIGHKADCAYALLTAEEQEDE